MPEQDNQDPTEKPKDDWLVGSEEVAATHAPVIPPAPPTPDSKQPINVPLVVTLVLMGLLGAGGYFYLLRSHAAKVQEISIDMPKQPEEAAPAKAAQATIPSSGTMRWSGRVARNGTIVIDGGKSKTGAVTGAVLPGVPITVRVQQKGFTVAQAPSADSGWKRIGIHSRKRRR